MDFSEKIDALLRSVGEPTTVSVNGSLSEVCSIIQPMRYKNKMYLEQERTQLGFKDGECFLYLGPKEVDFTGVERDTIIKTQDRCYNVSRADRINVNGNVQYIWAVLTLRIKDGVYDEL